MISNSSRPILVTGAFGFVGKYVLDALNSSGVASSHIVCNCQTEPTTGQFSNIYVQDLTDRQGVAKMIAELRPKSVIHLAAIAEPGEAMRHRDLAWDVNFGATRYLAEAILENAPDATLIFSGSAESYGLSFNDSKSPIREDSRLAPTTVYGATKAVSDIFLGQMMRDGLNVVRFRAFNHTGPGQPPNYVVPAFAEQIAEIEKGIQPPVIRVGNLGTFRDFLDVRDVASAYVSALELKGEDLPESAINISSGIPIQIKHILRSLLDLSEQSIEIVIDPERVRPSEVPYAVGDNSLLKRTLDWQPNFTFTDTVESVLNGFRCDISSTKL